MPCRSKPGKKKREAPPAVNLVDGLALTIGHFLPDLISRISAFPDPREQAMIWYPHDLLLTQALLMPLTFAFSRREYGEELCKDAVFKDNVAALLGRDVPELASAAAVNYFVERADPFKLEQILPELARGIIRMRALDRFRFEGEFLVAIDGVETFRQTNKLHCKHCLVAEHKDGRTDYFHQFVDTKLVIAEGMAVSLGFKAIENIDGHYEKQSCETLVGRQALEQLKRRFPSMRICILGDALYACEGTIDQIVKNGWSFFLSFLPGRMPNLYAEAEAKLAAHPEKQVTAQVDDDTHVYRWATNLKYGRHTLHAVFLEVTKPNGEVRLLSYLTNHRPDARNVRHLTDEGGRQRAKIENAFNTQKNHGYKIEHGYGSLGHALKNYYAIAQIAHLIHQLMWCTDLFSKLAGTQTAPTAAEKRIANAYKTIRQFVTKLAISLTIVVTAGIDAVVGKFGKIQIRFFPDSS